MNKHSGVSPTSSPKSKHSPTNKKKQKNIGFNNESGESPSPQSPIKYLLQNNIKLNAGKEGERTAQQIEIISRLLRQCVIFSQLEINLSEPSVIKDLCNGIVLIYCESPHIMQIKDNEIYVFFEGQGFQYMQNKFEKDGSRKYQLYENNQYIMLRKINTNEYFLSMQENNSRYHSTQKKYQLMVDQNTLIGKFSQQVFQKLFLHRIQQRQKNIVSVLKKVAIFNGLPISFYQQFSKFVSQDHKEVGQKVINRDSKSKFVYFIKNGTAQIHYFNKLGAKSPAGNRNYYISDSRPYTISPLVQFDSFGMQPPGTIDETEKQVVCTSECNFLKIDKRLLAIIITSFQLEFQQKSKLWSEVNINSQIKGQNYLTPQKQLLLKNVERIRTSQRKIRDIKLRYLSSSKSKRQIMPCSLPKQQSLKQPIIQEAYEEKQENSRNPSPQEKRRMIKTTQGRFRSTSIIKFINNFGGLEEQKQYDALRKKLNEDKESIPIQKVNQIELIVLDSDQARPVEVEKLSYTNVFDYKEKLQVQRFTKSTSRLERMQIVNKFIPKLQVKSTIITNGSKADSQMIGVFLDKKIKNQILKKAQKVLNINKNIKSTENRNLKRLFAACNTRPINAISELDKKSIAEDIVDKMSNLRENPLLLQIESERRKLQRQLKLSSRRAVKQSEISPSKKYKKEDQLILIKNQQ